MSRGRSRLCSCWKAGQSRYTGSEESLERALQQSVFPAGEGLYIIHYRKRAAELLEHLQLLIDLEPDCFWFVVLDNASAHTTAAIETFASQNQGRLELVYLPTYGPHLNLIERLWRVMRSQVLRNRFFESLSAVSEAVVNWLENLQFAQFCSVMGISEAELAFVDKPIA